MQPGSADSSNPCPKPFNTPLTFTCPVARKTTSTSTSPSIPSLRASSVYMGFGLESSATGVVGGGSSAALAALLAGARSHLGALKTARLHRSRSFSAFARSKHRLPNPALATPLPLPLPPVPPTPVPFPVPLPFPGPSFESKAPTCAMLTRLLGSAAPGKPCGSPKPPPAGESPKRPVFTSRGLNRFRIGNIQLRDQELFHLGNFCVPHLHRLRLRRRQRTRRDQLGNVLRLRRLRG